MPVITIEDDDAEETASVAVVVPKHNSIRIAWETAIVINVTKTIRIASQNVPFCTVKPYV